MRKTWHASTLLCYSVAVVIGAGATAWPVSALSTDRPPAARRLSRSASDDTPPSNYDVADTYADLRGQVLNIKPYASGQNHGARPALIAVLMETGNDDSVSTLLAVADGTSDLYFSGGGGIMGAGRHESVGEIARSLVTSGREIIPKATLTESFPLPQKDAVRFYLVTAGGVYTFEAPQDDLVYKRHPCSALFYKGRELITAIREHSPH